MCIATCTPTFLHCGRAEANSPYVHVQVHVHVCGAVYVSYCGSDLPLVHRLPARTGRQSTVLAGNNFWLTIMCTLPQACVHVHRLPYALCTALSDCSPFHCVQCPSLSGYVEMPAVLCVTGEGLAPKETQAKVVCTLAMSWANLWAISSVVSSYEIHRKPLDCLYIQAYKAM